MSLVELLVVIAIIGLLAALITPAVSSILQSSKLNTAVNLVMDQVALARQTALAQSRRVEVRFYEIPQPEDPEKISFSGIRVYQISETGDSTPLGPLRQLPYPIMISARDTQNTLFRNSSAYKGTEDLPKHKNAPFFRFSFTPNGRTDFPSGNNPYLTMYDSHSDSSGNDLPRNYAVLQVDAFTGNVRVFRP